MSLSRKNNFPKYALVIFVTIILLAIFFYKNTQNTNQKNTTFSDKSKQEQAQNMDIENREGVQEFDLIDVSKSEQKYSGKAYILRTNNMIKHKIIAQLPNLENDRFYEGWLVNVQDKNEFISTGQLSSINNNQYQLYFESDDVLDDFDFVVVTVETLKDLTPEVHVLESDN